LLLSGSGKPKDAIALIEQIIKLWRTQKLTELSQFKMWLNAK